MNRTEAFKLDTAFYAYLDDTDTIGVYGNNTGFCYATPYSWDEARLIAKRLTESKQAILMVQS